jgi:MFS transporter, FHS family, L-fucose permease
LEIATTTQRTLKPIYIIGALFFIFGFITWLNSVLIPYLKIACQLNYSQAYFVTFAFYIAYFVMAIPSGLVLNATGFKKGMSLGLIVIAIGALIFIPAAMTRQYGVFLVGLFVQGTGLALLQTASNPYVTILGPRESAARRISIMGVCNKIAGSIAPIVLGAIALKDVDHLVKPDASMSAETLSAELNELASRVIFPYVIIAVVLVILAILVYYSGLPEVDTNKDEESDDSKPASSSVSKTSILQFPNLLLGVLALFLYVGVEVLAGDSVINYAATKDIALQNAKFFTTCTLIAMLVGYFVGIGAIPKYLSQEKALTYSGILGLFFSILVLFTDGTVSVISLSLLGLANALVWPAIWPIALAGLGKFTKIGSSLLIMGIAGGAIIPLIYGKLSDVISPQTAYWILVPCYLFIIFYSFYGKQLAKAAKK